MTKRLNHHFAFANVSPDAKQEYFADAITDDLTAELSRIADSFVIARTTAFTYKGGAVNVRHVARELSVRYVLKGSVRRAGEWVQVNVQLIDAIRGSGPIALKPTTAISPKHRPKSQAVSLILSIAKLQK